MNIRSIRFLVAVPFVVSAFGTAQAQVADHLQCYKLKDPLKLEAFVDLNSPRNLFIIGFAFFMGLSVPHYFGITPVDFDFTATLRLGDFSLDVTQLGADLINTLGKTGMAVGAFIALFLDNTIPGSREERGLTGWSRQP